MTDAYLQTLESLAWVHLFARRDAAAAEPVLAALRALLSDEDVGLARLTGWKYLVTGNNDEALAKFTAVADRDPLAALGMVQINLTDPAKRDAALARARKLLADYRSGVMGATLHAALHPVGIPIAAPPAADALKAALDNFPAAFVDIIDNPQRFYILRGDPRHVSHRFGEAVLADVTLRNVSDFDLAIGPDGVLKPQVVFDGRLTGVAQKDVPIFLADDLAQVVVLPAHQAMTRTVRMDVATMADALAQQPSAPLDVMFTVTSNPVNTGKQMVPGPAGYRVQFARPVERVATPAGTPEARKALIETATAAAIPDRLAALDAMAAYVRLLANPPAGAATQPDTGAGSIVNELADALRRLASDPQPEVHAWANYLIATSSAGDAAMSGVTALAADADPVARLLAIAAASNLPDRGSAVAAKLVTDTDPTVRAAAAGLIQATATPPASRPVSP